MKFWFLNKTNSILQIMKLKMCFFEKIFAKDLKKLYKTDCNSYLFTGFTLEKNAVIKSIARIFFKMKKMFTFNWDSKKNNDARTKPNLHF